MSPSQTGIVRLSKGDRHRISFKSISVAQGWGGSGPRCCPAAPDHHLEHWVRVTTNVNVAVMRNERLRNPTGHRSGSGIMPASRAQAGTKRTDKVPCGACQSKAMDLPGSMPGRSNRREKRKRESVAAVPLHQ